ncbi:hypothetical protein KBD08_03720 [Candidatus Babeliales bacterium]|nr:hypothetical protein [Candidatus Babeliales bacterium]
MIFNQRFSLFKAYVTGVRTTIEYFAFYLAWYGLLVLLCAGCFIGIGMYAEILDISELRHNMMDFFTSVQSLLTSDMKDYVKNVSFDTRIQDWLTRLIPSSWLNQSIADMSFREYYNIVIMRKIIGLSLMVLAVTCASMTIAIGFIKTALSLQAGGKVSYKDMYQHYKLVPYYFAAKCITVLLCLLPVVLFLMIHSTLGSSVVLLNGIICGIMFVVIYQRFRFAKYFIIERHFNPYSAFEASWHLTHCQVIHLTIFSIMSVAILPLKEFLPIAALFGMFNKQAEVNIYRQLLETM